MFSVSFDVLEATTIRMFTIGYIKSRQVRLRAMVYLNPRAAEII